MTGVLVGCDMDVATPLPQYLVYVHGPFTPYVIHIIKKSTAYIHQRNTVNDPYIKSYYNDHMSHMHK
jgi:hypothetical protein